MRRLVPPLTLAAAVLTGAAAPASPSESSLAGLVTAQGFPMVFDLNTRVEHLCSVAAGPARYDYYLYQRVMPQASSRMRERLIEVKDGVVYAGSYDVGMLTLTCDDERHEVTFADVQNPALRTTVKVGEAGLPRAFGAAGAWLTAEK